MEPLRRRSKPPFLNKVWGFGAGWGRIIWGPTIQPAVNPNTEIDAGEMEAISDGSFGQAVARSREDTARLGEQDERGHRSGSRLLRPPGVPSSGKALEDQGAVPHSSERPRRVTLPKWLFKEENKKLRFLHFSPRHRPLARGCRMPLAGSRRVRALRKQERGWPSTRSVAPSASPQVPDGARGPRPSLQWVVLAVPTPGAVGPSPPRQAPLPTGTSEGELSLPWSPSSLSVSQ